MYEIVYCQIFDNIYIKSCNFKFWHPQFIYKDKLCAILLDHI